LDIELFYIENKYIKNNPTLHEEDSQWKIGKILPLIDKLFKDGYINKKEISLLDVGGGAGLILKGISEYITTVYNVKVNQICLDLSPGMLISQSKINPNAEIFNENITATTLQNCSIDIALMIDVLEHIPDWENALEELRRISDFVIFKIPIDRNLSNIVWNFINNGEVYKKGVESIGHVNWFDMNTLVQGVNRHFGHILLFYFTNVFDYSRKNNYSKCSKIGKVTNRIGRLLFPFSPTLCSRLFSDYVMILAGSSLKRYDMNEPI
jgi:SAM-dependent methyltransferase